jgi:glycosyltransferase involved in cell wall biosynthesis
MNESRQEVQEVPPALHDPLVSIIIPIYNERKLIREVLRRVRLLPLRMQLILVDDASRDGTYELLCEEEAPKPGTLVLRHPKNRGKGAAIRTGLEHAQGEIVLIQDADLEYQPEELPRLLGPIIEGTASVVYGSRFMGSIQKMRLPNRVANHLLAWLVSVLYGQRITDEATAYKIFRREVIQSIDLKCERFEFCPEATAKVCRMGIQIREVPIRYFPRTVQEGKKIRWRDGVQAIWTLLYWRFARFRPLEVCEVARSGDRPQRVRNVETEEEGTLIPADSR